MNTADKRKGVPHDETESVPGGTAPVHRVMPGHAHGPVKRGNRTAPRPPPARSPQRRLNGPPRPCRPPPRRTRPSRPAWTPRTAAPDVAFCRDRLGAEDWLALSGDFPALQEGAACQWIPYGSTQPQRVDLDGFYADAAFVNGQGTRPIRFFTLCDLDQDREKERILRFSAEGGPYLLLFRKGEAFYGTEGYPGFPGFANRRRVRRLERGHGQRIRPAAAPRRPVL